jgi:ADP-ribose pyrophosphatase
MSNMPSGMNQMGTSTWSFSVIFPHREPFAADPSLCEYYGGYLLMAKHDYPDVPRVGVGAVVIKDGRVLLVRRGIPPSEGLWAIPGGHVELGETLQETAEREILEETGVVVTARNPIYTFDLIERDKSGRIRFHYIVVDVKADYVSGEPRGSDDALEARWLSWDEIRELPVSNNTIKLLKSIKFAL